MPSTHGLSSGGGSTPPPTNVRQNNAEGGTVGTEVTTSNSGGASGTAWDLVQGIKFVNSPGGGVAYGASDASVANKVLQWTVSSQTTATVSLDVYLDSVNFWVDGTFLSFLTTDPEHADFWVPSLDVGWHHNEGANNFYIRTYTTDANTFQEQEFGALPIGAWTRVAVTLRLSPTNGQVVVDATNLSSNSNIGHVQYDGAIGVNSTADWEEFGYHIPSGVYDRVSFSETFELVDGIPDPLYYLDNLSWSA